MVEEMVIRIKVPEIFFKVVFKIKGNTFELTQKHRMSMLYASNKPNLCTHSLLLTVLRVQRQRITCFHSYFFECTELIEELTHLIKQEVGKKLIKEIPRK